MFTGTGTGFNNLEACLKNEKDYRDNFWFNRIKINKLKLIMIRIALFVSIYY